MNFDATFSIILIQLEKEHTKNEITSRIRGYNMSHYFALSLVDALFSFLTASKLRECAYTQNIVLNSFHFNFT